MELLNATKMQAEYTLGMEPDGRERLVVVVKGTFVIPKDGHGEPELADDQVPLIMADEFTGEPGLSAPVYESDFAAFKPRCDVLLNGSAYAPAARPAECVTGTLRVASINKSFDVVGDRIWDKLLLSVTPSEPKPFQVMPITYDRAFGGVDTAQDDPDKCDAYTSNPIGIGYYPVTRRKNLVGKPLPNTQQTNNPVKSPTGKYVPMSFGPIGRNFESRVAFAGTYDQNWLDNVFPFLPDDFDPRYYQAAPTNQQIDYPRGGEMVELINLTPNGQTTFPLPKVQVPVEFNNASYERTEVQAVLDTIIIEPDEDRLMLVWRASAPLKKNIFEMRQVIVGRMSPGWYRAREAGKSFITMQLQVGEATEQEQEEGVGA
jgi:hypothetical protein